VPALGAQTEGVLAEWSRPELAAGRGARRRSGIGQQSGFWRRLRQLFVR